MEFVIVLFVLAALFAVLFIKREYLAGFALTPSDIRALVVGGRTDDKVSQLRKDLGDRSAFEAVYAEADDPWTSLDPRNGYQERKYKGILSFLPKDRRFTSALDLGCGLGALSRRLAARSESVLGIDVAQSAIDRAATQCRDVANLRFVQGDIFNLPAEMNGKFDLVMLVDTLYYAPLHTIEAFRTAADRVADLLMPGGLCVVSNHYFVSDDPTILSRRIFAGFRQCPKLQRAGQHWRPFYRTVIFTTPRSTNP